MVDMIREGIRKRSIVVLCLIVIFGIVFGCGPKPSPLIITDKDREIFDTILDRGSDEVRFFSSYDGTPIACTVVRPDAEPVAVILFIHGITARSGLYVPLADSLSKHGYLSYMMDVRGHGFSQGDRGDAPDDSSLIKDTYHFYRFVRKEVGTHLPILALGHSLGTFVWIATLGAFPQIQVDGLILMSGAIPPRELNREQSKRKDVDFFYTHPLILMASLLIHDLKPIEIILPDEPQLQRQGFVTRYSLRFLQNIQVNKSFYDRFFGSFQKPVLMISGRADEIMPAELVERSYAKLETPDKTLKIVDGATHTSIIWDSASPVVGWLNERFSLP